MQDYEPGGKHLVKGATPPCNKCKNAEANPIHLLVTCPKLADSRKILISELNIISLTTYNRLIESTSREKRQVSYLEKTKAQKQKANGSDVRRLSPDTHYESATNWTANRRKPS